MSDRFMFRSVVDLGLLTGGKDAAIINRMIMPRPPFPVAHTACSNRSSASPGCAAGPRAGRCNRGGEKPFAVWHQGRSRWLSIKK